MKNEQEGPVYETETEILSFLETKNICFFDSYGFNIPIDGINYPTVRHAVLSFKTEDIEQKKEDSKNDTRR